MQKAHHTSSQPIETSAPFPTDPMYSFWVTASAGTGKTKTLIDRLLRLFIVGADPTHIVCVTYTRAAAREIHERLQQALYTMSVMTDADLCSFLNILCRGAFDGSMSYVRNLYARFLERPLSVQTIHSFCMQILRGFPLEAGITFDISLTDEEDVQRLQRRAMDRVMRRDASHDVSDALCLLSKHMSEAHIRHCLEHAIAYRTRVNHHNCAAARRHVIHAAIPKPPISYASFQDHLSTLADMMIEHGSKSLHTTGGAIRSSLSHSMAHVVHVAFTALFTNDGARRKKLANKPMCAACPAIEDVIDTCQNYVEMLYLRMSRDPLIHVNEAFDVLFQAVMATYASLKRAHNVMDFDDVLEKTHDLLSGHHAWVMEKWDGGYDHIILDEAQDTSPLQWSILKHLLTHFFETPARHHTPCEGEVAEARAFTMPRTLYVVGDVKQSIYRFQGADPVLYQDMAQYVKTVLAHAGQILYDYDLNTCFRCVPEILTVVDQVCAHPHVKAGLLTPHTVTHPSARHPHEGHADFFPAGVQVQAFASDMAEGDEVKQEESFAHFVCDTIENWVTSKAIMPATQKPVCYDDVLVVMQRRGTLMNTLARVMKSRRIPHTCQERDGFLNHQSVQDFLVFLQCLNCSYDDVHMACFLKNPLMGVSEETLQELCHRESETCLWDVMAEHPLYDAVSEWIVPPLSGDALYQHLYRYLSTYYEAAHDLYTEDMSVYFDTILSLLDQAFVERGSTLSAQDLIHWVTLYGAKPLNSCNHQKGVRIMTVHGSKGLQSPIVMVVDAAKKRSVRSDPIVYAADFYMLSTHPSLIGEAFDDGSRLTWPWVMKDISLLCEIKTSLHMEEKGESMRLLYVAMTRAQDALWVSGSEDQGTESWMSYLTPALSCNVLVASS